MAKPRLELQSSLEELLGTRNVYFQPPETKKLSYPCIIYSFRGYQDKQADNIRYRTFKRYDLTIIDKDPGSDLPDKIRAKFRYCSFDRFFVSDNLNHFSFTLYF